MASTMRLEGLSKSFGEALAVDDFSLQFRESELIALLGPSGCGKTTTLRMIAGFEQPTAGSIHVNERDVTWLPPERRNAGMVFQSYALFPHMTVRQNVAFGLQMRRVDRARAATRVAEVIDRVGLSGLEERYPRQLSGGQQQRTALARALVISPDVLLLDEPLANLDANLREEMRVYIRKIQRDFGITTIYVTHDQAEALALADRIAVMIAGRLQQLDEPETVYRRPINEQVARFLGVGNLIEAKIRDRSPGRARVETAVGLLVCAAAESFEVGERAFVGVRPRDVQITMGNGVETANRVHGALESRVFLGNHVECQVRTDPGVVLRVHAPPGYDGELGDRVTATIDDADCWLVKATADDDRG